MNKICIQQRPKVKDGVHNYTKVTVWMKFLPFSSQAPEKDPSFIFVNVTKFKSTDQTTRKKGGLGVCFWSLLYLAEIVVFSSSK